MNVYEKILNKLDEISAYLKRLLELNIVREIEKLSKTQRRIEKEKGGKFGTIDFPSVKHGLILEKIKELEKELQKIKEQN